MSKLFVTAAFIIVAAVFFAACGTDDTPYIPYAFETSAFSAVLRAEEAELFGNVRLTRSGTLEGFEQENDRALFTVEIPEDGFYDLNFITAGMGGSKENFVTVGGERLGTVFTASEDFGSAVITRVFLTQGQNVIGFEAYWGWTRLESLYITNSAALDPAIFDVSAELINPNASERAKRLMSYLADSYGEVILTGQYSDDGLFAGEAAIIFMETGKRPAVLGLDLMDLTPSRVARGTSTRAIEHAITADEHGAIVTFCWHWNTPEKYITGTWYKAFYTEATDIDLAKIMSGADPEGYELLIGDIDAISEQLKILRDADIPVLWRPLHEASGGWFWWGASGSEPYIELWRLMYERMTFEHELNNLIWLWNGQHADWYPGDEYVDIIGEDIYAGEHNYVSQISKFIEAVNYTNPPKIVVLSENGTLFDPDLAWRDGAMWGFFATWTTPFVRSSNAVLRYSEEFTEREMLLKVYSHERVITLEELPDLRTYPIRKN